MISREEVLKLAALSRIRLSDDEVLKMQSDMGAILAYVDTLKSAPTKESGPIAPVQRNILRDDAHAHEGGVFTDTLINLAPKHEKTADGQFVKVKKILGGSQ
ncbi:MAG TPA: Asp-tRNA(Asn)/Glu-tRNA(Gln) amidotransferase subunit GatC [Candidatus Paceibacterota bacterium]|jgi:Asp-tRNAAsn/Glu-tRNAGln amidotransferase C subunit